MGRIEAYRLARSTGIRAMRGTVPFHIQLAMTAVKVLPRGLAKTTWSVDRCKGRRVSNEPWQAAVR